ncbi:MAG: hypothetical protein ACO39X_08160, partial [Candidatus Nanopelagicaceae bacterium]
SIALLHQPVAASTLVVVLPVTRLEAGAVLADGREILLVEEVCTVTAASLLEMRCIVIQHAFATLTVDALVIGAHESLVEHPRLIAIVVVET